ncbi:MAG: ABC transporter substrate-binding protein [Chloroflexi bacterium]|nr:ABC transporter substrate-binding protein [Chloroflexota bacterium]
MMLRLLSALAAIVVLVLAACSPAATATPLPTPTAVPRSSGVTPTATAKAAPSPTAAAQGKYGGTLKLAYDREGRAWDPFRTTTADLHPWVVWDHARLLRFNADPALGCSYMPPIPELATSWKWVDDRTLELKLRQGVKWPNLPPVNGREFVASDVVYSIRVAWPKSSYQAYYLDMGEMQSVDAVDDHTVKISFKKPMGAFLDSPAAWWWGIITAPEIMGPDNEMNAAEDHVGLGPYTLKKYVPGARFFHERNANYWRPGLPYIDNVEYSIMPDISTQVAALRSKVIDAVPHPQPHPVVQDQLSKAPGIKVYACPWPIFYGFLTTTEEGSRYRDVRVRRAISMAIDREGVNRSAYLGLGYTNEAVMSTAYGEFAVTRDKLPPEVAGYLQYRPDEAKRLLAEAGFPNGFNDVLYVTPRYGALHMALAEAVVDQLGRAGIKLKLEPLEYGRYAEVVIGKKFTGTAIGWAGGNSPDNTLDKAHSKGPANYSRINDPELDAVIEQFTRTGDMKLAQQAQTMMVERMHSVPLPTPPFAGWFRDVVKNVNFKPHYVASVDYLLYSWLDR